MFHTFGKILIYLVLFFCYATGACFIELSAFGYRDEVWDGYIRVNGEEKLHGNEGINVAIVDRSSCNITDFKNYNTRWYTSKSDELAAYVLNLPVGTVLLGFSQGDASSSLTPAAKQMFMDNGVNLTSLAWAWKFVFSVVVGNPRSSVFELQSSGGRSVAINVTVGLNNVTGTSTSFLS